MPHPQDHQRRFKTVPEFRRKGHGRLDEESMSIGSQRKKHGRQTMGFPGASAPAELCNSVILNAMISRAATCWLHGLAKGRGGVKPRGSLGGLRRMQGAGRNSPMGESPHCRQGS